MKNFAKYEPLEATSELCLMICAAVQIRRLWLDFVQVKASEIVFTP